MAKRKSSPFLYLYIYAAVILIGHSIPASRLLHFTRRLNRFFQYLFSDTSFHFFVFGFFAWLLCYGYYKAGKKKVPYVRIFLVSLFYGALIEVWQAVLPYRYFDRRDLLFDFLGISVFMIAFWAMRRWGIFFKQEKHA